MESRKLYYFKIFASILFASAILGAFVYVCIKGDIQHNILSFSCICACLVLSLMFIRRTAKKFIFTLALAVNVVADYFLVLMPSADNQLIGVCVMAAVQALFLLYTLFLFKGNGLRVISLALRVGLCLLAYFLLPKYFALTTIQMIYAMIVINAFVTLLTFLLFFKTQWIAFFGFLLLFAFTFFSALSAGWAVILNFPISFLEILFNPFWLVPGLAYVFYIPAVLLLALASVWEKGVVSKKTASKKVVAKTQTAATQSTTIKAQPQADTINRPSQTEGISTISLDDL